MLSNRRRVVHIIRQTCARFSTASTTSATAFMPGGWDLSTFISNCETRSIYINSCLRLKVEEVSEGKITLRLPKPKEEHQLQPAVGLIGLIDHSGGYSSWTLLKKEQFLSTVNLRIDFLNNALTNDAMREDVIAEAVVNSLDDRFIRTDVTCWTGDKKTKLALGRLLFGVYPSPIGTKQPPANYSEMVERGSLHSEPVMKVSTIEGAADKPGKITTRLQYQDILMGNRLLQVLHGGVPAAFLEESGKLCAVSLLDSETHHQPHKHHKNHKQDQQEPEQQQQQPQQQQQALKRSVSTVDLDINFLRGAPMNSNLVCDAIVSSRTARLIRVDFTCFDEGRTKKVVCGSGLYMIQS